MIEKNEKNIQSEIEKRTETVLQEDSNDKKDCKEVMQKQENNENDVGRSIGKKGKNKVLEENNSDERRHLFVRDDLATTAEEANCAGNDYEENKDQGKNKR